METLVHRTPLFISVCSKCASLVQVNKCPEKKNESPEREDKLFLSHTLTYLFCKIFFLLLEWILHVYSKLVSAIDVDLVRNNQFYVTQSKLTVLLQNTTLLKLDGQQQMD